MKKDLLMWIQYVLVVILIIVLIMTSFISELLTLIYFIMSFLLITTGINNQFIYKRKYMTWIYYICGILLLVFTCFELIVGL